MMLPSDADAAKRLFIMQKKNDGLHRCAQFQDLGDGSKAAMVSPSLAHWQ